MHLRLKRKKKGKQKRSRHLDPRQRSLLRRSLQVPQVLQCPAKASNRPSTSKTVAAATTTTTTTKEGTRVDQVLEVEVEKVINGEKFCKSNATTATFLQQYDM